MVASMQAQKEKKKLNYQIKRRKDRKCRQRQSQTELHFTASNILESKSNSFTIKGQTLSNIPMQESLLKYPIRGKTKAEC